MSYHARMPAAASRTLQKLLIPHVAVAALAAGLAAPAAAHDAIPTAAKPQGWSYPFSCCSGYDCREVSSKQVSEKPEGYVIKGTGEIVAYSDARLKDSPDGEYHWCSVAGADDSRTICLFVPPRSY
jgi:hypothetical protein